MSMSRFSRALHGLGRVVLAVTAGLGVACLILLLVGAVTGERPLVFRSGSMSPGITAGALGFARTVDATEISVGDIVTVHTAGGTRVTHRVVDLTRHGDEATLRLKGDANNLPDEALYPVREAPRLSFAVPKAGYGVAWLSHAPGSYVLALYVALMLLLVARRRGPGSGETSGRVGPVVEETDRSVVEPPEQRDIHVGHRRHRGPRTSIALASALAVGVALVVGWGSSTWASWTDTAAVSGTTLSTGTFLPPPAAPVVSCGTLGKKLVTLTWTTVPGATSYDLYYPDGSTLSGNQTSTTFAFDGVANVVGDFSVRAKNASAVSAMSNAKHYDTGTGSSGQSCTSVTP